MKPINFELYQDDHCCGLLNLGSFEADQGGWGTRSTDKPSEEVYKEFFDKLKKESASIVNPPHEGYYVVRCSLMVKGSRWPADPFQIAVAELLKEHKWKVDNVFINANTGNEVMCFSKKISHKAIKKVIEADASSW